MFVRCLTELVRDLRIRMRAIAVEACEQMIWEAGTRGPGKSPIAFSRIRIRIQTDEGERQLTSDCWMPDADWLTAVVKWLTPEEPVAPIPIPDESPVSHVQALPTHQIRSQRDTNWMGHCREILVNSYGLRCVADVPFQLVRTELGYRMAMAPVKAQLDSRRVLLDPLMVPSLITAGWLRDVLAITTPHSWLHDGYDGIGLHERQWVRLPVTLALANTVLTLSGLSRGTFAGVPVVWIDADRKKLTVRDGRGRVARLEQAMVQSIEQVSEMVLVTDGHLPYRLPWVAVEGDWRWA